MKTTTTKSKRSTGPVITIQNASAGEKIPAQKLLKQWCTAALNSQKIKHGELCIRLIDSAESAALNLTYRQKKGATNILSFPSTLPTTVHPPQWGDLAICTALVNQEAREQHKAVAAHWAHIVIHGTLHLLGFDHQKPQEIRKMEALEIKILQQLGFDNPYN